MMTPTALQLDTDFSRTTVILPNKSEFTNLNNVLSEADANHVFRELSNLSWNSTLAPDSVRPSYESFWYGSQDYTYSGVKHCGYKGKISIIDSLIAFINESGKYEYDSVLINKYTEASHVPSHKDDADCPTWK